MEKIWWIITIGGLLETHAFYGTKDEAEKHRVAKSDWDGMGGRKAKANVHNPKHVKLVDQMRESLERKLGNGMIDSVPPPLEDRKEQSLQKGFNTFIKPKNIKYGTDMKMIEILSDGRFRIIVQEDGDILEEHYFATFDRASNYATIMNLV